MSHNTYAIGFTRGKRTHYLKTRETNFRRACKTVRDMLKSNKRYKIGGVYKVIFDSLGEEFSMVLKYQKEVK